MGGKKAITLTNHHEVHLKLGIMIGLWKFKAVLKAPLWFATLKLQSDGFDKNGRRFI